MPTAAEAERRSPLQQARPGQFPLGMGYIAQIAEAAVCLLSSVGHTHGQCELLAPKVRPSAKREKAKGSSSATRFCPESSRATNLPTPVILKPWLLSAIM